jgi:hypothetical protein
MYLDEFISYVDKNSRAEEIFYERALAFQIDKNERRQKSARWTQSKMEKECEKMWEATIKGTYNNVATNIKAIEKKPRFHNHDDEVDYWVNFLNENEFLESFTDGISDAEFE